MGSKTDVIQTFVFYVLFSQENGGADFDERFFVVLYSDDNVLSV